MVSAEVERRQVQAEQLRRENAKLGSENEDLRARVKGLGLSAEAAEPSMEAQEQLLAERLAVSRRERMKLKELQRLGAELQQIQEANAALNDNARRLVDQNKVLRETVSQNLASRKNRKDRNMGARELSPKQKQAMSVADKLRKGESSVPDLGKQQRKEMVAALLRAGIYSKEQDDEVEPPEPTNPLAPLRPMAAPTSSTQPQPPSGAPRFQASQNSAPYLGQAKGPGAPAVPSRGLCPTAAELDTGAKKAPPPSLDPRQAALEAHQAQEAAQRARDVADKAQQLGAALGKGDRSALKSVGTNDRKDMIAQMLQNGFMGKPTKPEPLATSLKKHASAEEKTEFSYMKQEQMRGALHGLTKAAPMPLSPSASQHGSRHGSRQSSRHASRHVSRQASPRNPTSPGQAELPDGDFGSSEENSFAREAAVREMLAQVASLKGR